MTTSPNPDPDIEAAIQRLRIARDEAMLRHKRNGRGWNYRKLDCIARQGSHSAAEVIYNLPRKDL